MADGSAWHRCRVATGSSSQTEGKEERERRSRRGLRRPVLSLVAEAVGGGRRSLAAAGEEDEGDPVLQRLRAPTEATARRSRPRRSSWTCSLSSGSTVAAVTTGDGGDGARVRRASETERGRSAWIWEARRQVGRGDGEARGVGGSYPLVDDAGEPVRWRPRPSGRSSSRRRPRVGVGLLGRSPGQRGGGGCGPSGWPRWAEAQGEARASHPFFFPFHFFYFLFFF